MNLKQFVKSLLPPVILPFLRTIYPKRKIGGGELQQLLEGGKIPWIPWDHRYDAYKRQFVAQVLDNKPLFKLFQSNQRLPSNYGRGIDERCVEYPWLFSRLPVNAKCILDAGSVLNHEFLLDRLNLSDRKLHIMTLAPEWTCWWQRGISYLYGDLREIPIRDNYYDAIVCLSTLEHIGCDNTIYVNDRSFVENHPEDFQLVMQELRRLLQPSGSLFLSVPFGTYHHHGTFQQFDRALLNKALRAFGNTENIIETFYRYTNDGWQVAKDSECAKSEYVEWAAEAWRQHKIPSEIPVESDLAAAARAVACVQLVKQ